MLNSNRKKIRSVYEELKGILDSIANENSWFDDEGFSQRANDAINRAKIICPDIENITSYMIKSEHSNNRGGIIYVIPAKANLSSLMGRIKGEYELEELLIPTGHTFIQNQQQNQSQTLSVALELQEKIISAIPKHAENTKERGFLEKFKSVLPTIKNMTDILSLALKIGADLGLDPATIQKLLGL